MKQRILLFIPVAAVLSALSLFSWPRFELPQVVAGTPTSAPTALPSSPARSAEPKVGPPGRQMPGGPGRAGGSTRAEGASDKVDKQWQWKMPINFYGLVVDESGKPVAGVRSTS